MLVVQVARAAADALLRPVQDLTVILGQTTVVIKIWEDAVFLDRDFLAAPELEIIVKVKTVTMQAVVAAQAAQDTAVKMINNKDCCATVAPG
jgi:hypothetical protein